MIREEYVNHQIVPEEVETEFSPTKEHIRVGYVPVNKDNQFIGLLDLHDAQEGVPLTIKESDLIRTSFVNDDRTWFEVINLMRDQDLDQLAVLDNESNYIGMVGADNVIDAISDWAFVKDWGGIIIVENAVNQYSASEISRIVESENFRLTALFLLEFNDDKFRALIKVNHDDLSAVSDAFKRHGYRVVFRRFTEKMNEHIKERYDQLMKYLDM